MGSCYLRHTSKGGSPMSALGHKQTSRAAGEMSALPPKADIGTPPRNAKFIAEESEKWAKLIKFAGVKLD